ncbi:DNA-binding response regulator [Oxalicibacterium flavum]|uniref:DNA-binding response regulator n=1 Tax=Oxalicibacterium flavum TaxID=179467 RepID=A0A8J2ULH4_9BURK|nr:response regulator transcription factor [Oxalicibacterium flavum]GGC01937.1 DNA-binding response regulator [Oxalicibacterium flavum]
MSTLTNDTWRTGPVVLVVDDVPGSLGMIHETLENAGYTVLVADDGQTALQRLQKVVPDAILMDAVMPGMSGFEACRRLKADPALRHIPVIFMTGLSETSDVLEGFAAGGVDYVVKPVQAVEVLARLRTHIATMQSLRAVEQVIDAEGAGLLVLGHGRRLIWQSSCAARLLNDAGIDLSARELPPAWLPAEAGQSVRIPGKGNDLDLRHLAVSARGEIMLLVSVPDAPVHIDGLARLSLTPRETEVLCWLAKGKTNRDIGDILQLSPRTVSKHLEHVFQKLGVETRSAAAAMATSLQLDETVHRP